MYVEPSVSTVVARTVVVDAVTTQEQALLIAEAEMLVVTWEELAVLDVEVTVEVRVEFKGLAVVEVRLEVRLEDHV